MHLQRNLFLLLCLFLVIACKKENTTDTLEKMGTVFRFIGK